VIAGVVLAAGTSSRMGRHKLLLDLGGTPVLQHVLDAAAAAPLDEVVVVVGRDAQRVAGAVRWTARTRFVLNPAFETGQASSLLAGLGAVEPDAEAAVILLGDQPGVRSEAIEAVVEAFRDGGGPAVQASYGGRPAHPTLLGRSLWPSLQGLSGDEGARGLLESLRSDRRTLVELGGEPPDDLDTDRDYERLRARFAGASSRPRA